MRLTNYLILNAIEKCSTNKYQRNCSEFQEVFMQNEKEILFFAEQQPEKVPIWLVGDENKKFIE